MECFECTGTLHASIQCITNIKAGTNQKLFGKRSAMQLARNLSELDEHAL
ncbi:MAG: hypothetical protein IKN83_03485 [Bacteroidaceae bacterium]|nr:hypothetical protein [Bacteroidaceae bacterium]